MTEDGGFEFEPVDAAALVSVVRRLAETRPDFVYVPEDGPGGSCRYTHRGGKPGCIIGCALFELGTSIPYDHPWNGEYTVLSLTEAGLISGSLVWGSNTSWLQLVQANQDSCGEHSWAEAVRRADAGLAPGDDEDDSEAADCE